MTLAGTHVLVVGGTSGMGRATVMAARTRGAEVTSAGSRPLAVRERVDGVTQAEVDVTDEPSVEALSEMWSGLSEGEREDLRNRVAAAMPVRRMGTPEDIAHAALFLMTSPQITGAILEVSGGEPLVDRVG